MAKVGEGGRNNGPLMAQKAVSSICSWASTEQTMVEPAHVFSIK